jgi:hypothetical protein
MQWIGWRFGCRLEGLRGRRIISASVDEPIVPVTQLDLILRNCPIAGCIRRGVRQSVVVRSLVGDAGQCVVETVCTLKGFACVDLG